MFTTKWYTLKTWSQRPRLGHLGGLILALVMISWLWDRARVGLSGGEDCLGFSLSFSFCPYPALLSLAFKINKLFFGKECHYLKEYHVSKLCELHEKDPSAERKVQVGKTQRFWNDLMFFVLFRENSGTSCFLLHKKLLSHSKDITY